MSKKNSTTIPTFTVSSEIYKPSDINIVIDKYVKGCKVLGNNKRIYYYNIPCAFDIETTSTDQNGIKYAFMYEWTFGINGAVIIGRTWDEFLTMYKTLCEALNLNYNKRLICYVHNLSFEFQFIRKYLEWEETFSLEERKPLKCLTTDGLEFRCSYMLSGVSLKKMGEDLTKYKVKKMVGDLDYSLIRTNITKLTDEELKYCENDVRVVMSYIQEKIEQDGDIRRIQLTKTGYVRKYCRNACLYGNRLSHNEKKTNKQRNQYLQLMKALTLTSDEYKQLKRAFQGGFTHASAWKVGKLYNNVASYDFTSSYPAVMVAERFPMSRAEKVIINHESEFRKNIHNYCCLFDIEFHNIRDKRFIDHPISSSHCWHLENFIEDNGRIVSADVLATTITEQDFDIIEEFYEWDSFKIANFRRYKKGYLPTVFVKAILTLYQDKTQLKGIEGKEVEYMLAKGMLNSCYGMTVTDICRDEVIYDNEWSIKESNLDEQIEKYNKSKSRFLFYPWGVWVTAYARRNLFYGISEFGNDYIYSDTDSIKALNYQDHTDFIENYNKFITMKLEKACKIHGLPLDMIKPKTIKGTEKPLGVWDFEEVYKKFKTLGAKRYLIYNGTDYELTVSGLNKKVCVPYLKDNYKNIFMAFTNNLFIPKEYTGKNIHSYLDYEQCIKVVDYQGKSKIIHQLSSVHLDGAEYSLSLSKAFMNYLLNIKECERI